MNTENKTSLPDYMVWWNGLIFGKASLCKRYYPEVLYHSELDEADIYHIYSMEHPQPAEPKEVDNSVEGLPTIKQMDAAKREIRVYVWEAGNELFLHPNTSTDEDIMAYCERMGGVYTLDYFEEQCNNEELNLSNSFIRII